MDLYNDINRPEPVPAREKVTNIFGFSVVIALAVACIVFIWKTGG